MTTCTCTCTCICSKCSKFTCSDINMYYNVHVLQCTIHDYMYMYTHKAIVQYYNNITMYYVNLSFKSDFMLQCN